MSKRPNTRQELYDRIRKSSKDEVILEEMKRLGFWPKSTGKPGDPAEDLKRSRELQNRLNELRSKYRLLRNRDAMIKELRRQRILESRQRQKENKERRLRERRERAAAWARRKEREILFLGPGHSAGLNHVTSNHAQLTASGLPLLQTALDLAQAMHRSVGELRFLAFARTTSRVNHYVRFHIPKKTGGKRLISAPMPRLKAAQRWILENILEKLATHDAAHGFIAGRSIVTNAAPHVGQDVVVNLDLKDFFPTLTYRRVKGLFRALGYSEQIATLCGLLCTEPEIATAELDDTTWYVARSERRLPQGAPSSPAITNLICLRLDKRLTGAAEKLGFTYTRYADDLTFSGSDQAASLVGRLLRQVAYIVAEEGFDIHPDKTRILRKGRQQEVTGVVVNDQLGVDRRSLRRFRATLFQIEKDGPEGKRWGNTPDVLAAIAGYANFVHMIDPEKGGPLRARVAAILAHHNRHPPRPPQGPDDSGPNAPTEGGDGKKKKWWKVF